MNRSTTMWSPLLLIGLGVGVAVLAPAVGALWLTIIAAVLALAGGAAFYNNMQHT